MLEINLRMANFHTLMKHSFRMLSFALLAILLFQSPIAFSQDSESDPNLTQDDSGNLPAHNQEATEPIQQTQRRNTMGTNDNFEGGPVTRDTPEVTVNVTEDVLRELRVEMEFDVPSTGLILIIRNMENLPLMTMPKHWRWKKN